MSSLNETLLKKLDPNRICSKSLIPPLFGMILVVLSIPAFIALAILTQFIKNNFSGNKFGTGILIGPDGKPLVDSSGKPLTFESTIFADSDNTLRCVKLLEVGDKKEIPLLQGLLGYLIFFQVFLALYFLVLSATSMSNKGMMAANIFMLLITVFNIALFSIFLNKLIGTSSTVDAVDINGLKYKCLQFKNPGRLKLFSSLLYTSIGFTALQFIYYFIWMNSGRYYLGTDAEKELKSAIDAHLATSR